MIRSCTSFCEPKPIATPTMPAPASSGAMLMPISLRIIRPATMAMVISSVVRSSGSSVRKRADLASLGLALQPVEMLLDAAVDRLPGAERQNDGHQQGPARGQDTQAERALDQPEEGVQAVELQQPEDAQQVDRQPQGDGHDRMVDPQPGVHAGVESSPCEPGRMTRSTTPSSSSSTSLAPISTSAVTTK